MPPQRLHGTRAVALVITLLMLSVITFLTVAFLAMSRRNQSSVSASLDVAAARAMSDAAQARAQTEIAAQMLAHGDALYYDYMVSRNYINPGGYNNAEKTNDPNNVNYDYLYNTTTLFNNSTDPSGWVQNIANLWYDPRPPVFVVTNTYPTNQYDFRFWVDINRNGRFETNGEQPTLINVAAGPGAESIEIGSNAFLNGEPEFIGVLRNPLYPHSSSNLFIGRYAYLVLPIGKTLDINFIHNWLKGVYANIGALTNNSYPGYDEHDGFARDQGIGSWELNLAGVLDAVSPWAYESNNSSYGLNPYRYGSYNYVPPNPNNYNNGLVNTGNAFDDAESMLYYRYGAPSYTMASLRADFTNYFDFGENYMDILCADAPLVPPFDYYGPTNSPIGLATYNKTLSFSPWPGSYQTNMFFDPEDLLDPTKTSVYFTNRMILASQRTNTFDRYTFERLLSCVGMGSGPEYGVWVHDDYFGFPPQPPLFPPMPLTRLATKVNINYDNSAQINSPNGPYGPMPTNLVPWTPTKFFNNAAELLLRSQTFMFTNYVAGATNIAPVTPIVAQFGVTNIPIYRAAYPGVRYDASIHRMLQLAANIYDATSFTNYPSYNTNVPPVRHPSIFRPLFQLTNTGPGVSNLALNIAGYVAVTNDAYVRMTQYPFQSLSSVANGTFNTNWNVAGIPWIVAANKGLPEFNQYSYQSSILFERKALFVRGWSGGLPDTNDAPVFTNQFYCMSVSNTFGMDAWNPYPTPFYGTTSAGTTCYISNYITIQFTNNYNRGFTTNLTNMFQAVQSTPAMTWAAWPNNNKSSRGFYTFFSNSLVSLPPCYFSEFYKNFVFFTNALISSNSFLPADTNQTGWPVHNWTLNITNYVVYALFDGVGAESSSPPLLDFVNLGPLGSSVNIQQYVSTNQNALGLAGGTANPWLIGNANDSATSPKSQGLLNQVGINSYTEGNPNYGNDINGLHNNPGPHDPGLIFGSPYEPTNVVVQTVCWVANDPMVHYTADDLTSPNQVPLSTSPFPPYPLTNQYLGQVNLQRYYPWGASDTVGLNMLFKDPLVTGASSWTFPTNKFPGVGWLGRVHRGTPWQTVYLKADNPSDMQQPGTSWINWVVSPWFPSTGPGTPQAYEIAPETYPTNDWPLVDLFTTALDDNAARGLLSVNQTNDAAWAAVFAGVIVPTNANYAVQIGPNSSYLVNVQSLMDGPNGINALRTNGLHPNGILHKVGDILAAPALTVSNVAFAGNPAANTDEIVERIPQATLSLLKVGEPQFAIFAWGQSLRPKGPPFLSSTSANDNIYTNYEITGEFLSRTICHLVHTNGVLKMITDSYNVEPGN